MLGLGLALLQPLPFIGQHFMGLGLLGQNGSTDINIDKIRMKSHLGDISFKTITLETHSY
jgi:hypothetical protein